MGLLLDGEIYTPQGVKAVIGKHGTYYGKYPFQYETELILAKANKDGFTLPNMFTQIAIDNLIKGLNTLGLWNKLDIFFVFSYNDTALSNFSKINWKKPFGTLISAIGNTTYAATGWSGNNVDAYIDTGFNPGLGTNNYILNNASRGMVVTAAGAGATLDGTSGALNRLFLQNTVNHRINTTVTLSSSVDMSGKGFKMISRPDASNVLFVNNTAQTSIANTSASLANLNQYIFRSGAQYSGRELQCYFMGSSITYSESQQLRILINSFLQAVALPQIA